LTPRLSVNVNKVATLRNSRRGRVPDVVHAALACVNAGAGEVSIGHAIWAEALFHGIEHVVSYYLALLVGTHVEAKDR
jgi:pyridoxine 5'-phosphate synthase PdxJ